MEAQRPQGRHRGPPDQPRQLLDDGRRRRPREHVEVGDAARGPEREPRVRREHRVHRVRVPQQQAVRRPVPAQLEHEGKRAVEVEVGVVGAVAVPQRERAARAAEGEARGGDALPEAEEGRVRGHPRGELEVLVLEDEAQARGVEEG